MRGSRHASSKATLREQSRPDHVNLCRTSFRYGRSTHDRQYHRATAEHEPELKCAGAMLTSIVFGFIAARVSTGRAAAATAAVTPNHVDRVVTFSVATEFFVGSIILLTLSALVWMVAPAVVSAVRFCSPSVGGLLSVSFPSDCAPSSASWYVVKRALVGYAGLSFVVFCIALAWRIVISLRERSSRRAVSRWSVMVDDDGKE